MTTELQFIHPRDIQFNPDNPRKDEAPDALETLRASIKAFGILQPLLVRWEDGPMVWTCISGNRRLRVAKELELEEIPAIGLDAEEDDIAGIALAENFARAQMSPLDEAEAFDKLQLEKGTEAVAETFGVSIHYVKQRVALAVLPKTIRDMARAKAAEIPVGMLQALTAVSAETQADWLREMEAPPERRAWLARNPVDLKNYDRNKVASYPMSLALFDCTNIDTGMPQDLFAEEQRIRGDIFWPLQQAAVDKLAEDLKAEGWRDVWVYGKDRPAIDGWFIEADIEEQLKANKKAAKLQTKIDTITREIEQINEKIGEGEPTARQIRKLDALEAKARAFEDELIEIEKQIRNSEGMRSLSGVAIAIHGNGEVNIRRGVHLKLREAVANTPANDDEDEAPKAEKPKDDMSEAHTHKVRTLAAIIARSIILDQPRLALALNVALVASSRAIGILSCRAAAPHQGIAQAARLVDAPQTPPGSIALLFRQAVMDIGKAKVPTMTGLYAAADMLWAPPKKETAYTVSAATVVPLLQEIVAAGARAHDVKPEELIASHLRAAWTPDEEFFAGWKKAEICKAFKLMSTAKMAEARQIAAKRAAAETKWVPPELLAMLIPSASGATAASSDGPAAPEAAEDEARAAA